MAISAIVGLIAAIAILLTDGDVNRPINVVIFYGQRVFFYPTWFYSTFLALYSFTKGGLSRQYRSLLMKRHISFALLVVFCQTTGLINFMQFAGTYDFPGWIQQICVWYFVCVSVIISLLRLSEPIVFSTFKRDVTRCCRKAP
jgi:hypothetical protein